MVKLSNYNHFQERPDGSYLAYNAISGALAIMTKENYGVYNSIKRKLNENSNPDLTVEEKELYKQLEYANFIYSGDYDELDRLYFMHHLARYDSSSVGLVLAPTMACNMACEYCYEANKKGRMTAETIEAILKYIEKNAGKVNDVSLTWYGGEPLLAFDIIEDLSRSLIDLSEERKLKYSSYIITNGYLLNRDTVDKLVKLRVDGAQITLDGPARMHNKKRPLKNGQSSYERILENMVYASTKMRVSIRVNIDKSYDVDIISEMLEDLDKTGLRERVRIYFGLIEPATSACANISDNCFDIADYSRIETEFFKLIFDKGFVVEKLPSPTSNYCVAQSISGFVMDHEGNLYRCFNHIGDPEHAMGNIRNNISYYNENFFKLFRFDPFTKEQCRSCGILPICMGGCPSRRVEQDISDEDVCSSWKHNLPQMLEIIALSRQRQLASAKKESV